MQIDFDLIPLKKRNYDLKVARYEEVYKEKFDNKFEITEDIAGWN